MPAVISLAGDWDVFRLSELRRRLTPAHDVDFCIVDLRGFHCGDATFLDELIYLSKVRKAHGRSSPVLVIAPDDVMIREILRLTHLERVWPVYDSLEAAIAR